MAQAAKQPEDFLPLTPAEFHILLVLAESETHGYAIMREVTQRTNGLIRLGPGTLYSSIKRMLERGWIVETVARVDPSMDDERRKYYKLTDLGLRIAQAEAEHLAQTVQAARTVGLLRSAL